MQMCVCVHCIPMFDHAILDSVKNNVTVMHTARRIKKIVSLISVAYRQR